METRTTCEGDTPGARDAARGPRRESGDTAAPPHTHSPRSSEASPGGRRLPARPPGPASASPDPRPPWGSARSSRTRGGSGRGGNDTGLVHRGGDAVLPGGSSRVPRAQERREAAGVGPGVHLLLVDAEGGSPTLTPFSRDDDGPAPQRGREDAQWLSAPRTRLPHHAARRRPAAGGLGPRDTSRGLRAGPTRTHGRGRGAAGGRSPTGAPARDVTAST